MHKGRTTKVAAGGKRKEMNLLLKSVIQFKMVHFSKGEIQNTIKKRSQLKNLQQSHFPEVLTFCVLFFLTVSVRVYITDVFFLSVFFKGKNGLI